MDGSWLVSTDSGGAEKVSTWDDIDRILNGVKEGTHEFAIIEREKDSETLFFQTSIWTKGVALGRSFVAEVRFPDGEGFRQSRLRTKRFEDILGSARFFVDGSEELIGNWVDVTDEFIE